MSAPPGCQVAECDAPGMYRHHSPGLPGTRRHGDSPPRDQKSAYEPVTSASALCGAITLLSHYSLGFVDSPPRYNTPGSTATEDSTSVVGKVNTPPDSPLKAVSPGSGGGPYGRQSSGNHSWHDGSRGALPKKITSREQLRPYRRLPPVISTVANASPTRVRSSVVKSRERLKRDYRAKQEAGRSNMKPKRDSGYESRTGTVDSQPRATKIVQLPSKDVGLILQPDSSPISLDQLSAEVRGIYAGLVVVEAKCMNVDAELAAGAQISPRPEQWQALHALHRTLLYEHHDFLMATQHPSATPGLRQLAVKYTMPARMWKHAIHAYLEVLRYHRPESQDSMVSFIHLAYQMMALLLETVPAFVDTWTECLGDLARYRMAIEEDRESHVQWGMVAARWYLTAADKDPTIGRLSHHLGILERPSLQKLFCYAKSLDCKCPFLNARASLKTLCDPIAHEELASSGRTDQSAEACIVTFHAMYFIGRERTVLEAKADQALKLLAQSRTSTLQHAGVALAAVNIATVFGLGDAADPNRVAYLGSGSTRACLDRPCDAPDSISDLPLAFCHASINILLSPCETEEMIQDALPFAYITFAWLHSVVALHLQSGAAQTSGDATLGLLDPYTLNWHQLAGFLNSISLTEPFTNPNALDAVEQGCVSIPSTECGDVVHPVILAEEWAMRGLFWAQWLLPAEHFASKAGDLDGRDIETELTRRTRADRVLRLGVFLAQHTPYLEHDEYSRQFLAPKSMSWRAYTTQQMAVAPPKLLTGGSHPQSPVYRWTAMDAEKAYQLL